MEEFEMEQNPDMRQNTAQVPPAPPAVQKGRLWPALLSMGIMLVIGIAVFAITFTPAPQTQRDPDMPWFSISDGTLFFDSEYYPSETGEIELTVPETVADQQVTALGDGCFAGAWWLTTVYLPSSITSIGESAFHGCVGLRGIMLPEDLQTIGEDAFKNCGALEAIYIPGGVQNVGSNVFTGCEGMNFVFYGGTDAQWEALSFVGIPDDTMIMTADDTYPNG